MDPTPIMEYLEQNQLAVPLRQFWDLYTKITAQDRIWP